MPKIALTEAHVKVLVPSKSTFDIRDATLPGFGVHVVPLGTRRSFIHI